MVYGMPAFRWADDVEDLVNAGGQARGGTASGASQMISGNPDGSGL